MRNDTILLNTANLADYFTVEEAAQELKIKSTAIRNYLNWGKMQTYKFKTLTLISKADIEKWKERQKPK